MAISTQTHIGRPDGRSDGRTDRSCASPPSRFPPSPPPPRATMPLLHGGAESSKQFSLVKRIEPICHPSLSHTRASVQRDREAIDTRDGGGVAKYGGGRCMHRSPSRSLPSLLFGGEQFSPSPIPIIPRFRPSLRPSNSNEMNPSKQRKAGTTVRRAYTGSGGRRAGR